MIKRFTLRFGKAPSLPAETIGFTPITVFVGPNNSGKSKVLQELHRFCKTGETSSTDVIVDHLEFDGVKAFTGIMTEVVAGDPAVLLIDEPEAFLHPAMAFLLGREISRVTAGSEKRLFVSTHSPNFVMGCVQSGAPVTLVRLTYRDGIPTARVLASAEILRLMRNPLLRSTSVLTALFPESVVVTESDADRAFYQEINERLLRDRPDQGIPNCLFLNAQNKQTVPTIIRPLRGLGIATAGIVDIDVIKDGGATWTAVMDGAYLPELEAEV